MLSRKAENQSSEQSQPAPVQDGRADGCGRRVRGLAYYAAQRVLNPFQWSLGMRFLYCTGLFLGAGITALVLFVGHVQESSLASSAQDRLRLLGLWIGDEMHTQRDSLLGTVSLVASVPDVIQCMAARDREKLKNFILPYVERVRVASGNTTLSLHFHLPPGISFLRTWNATKWGDDLTPYRSMVVRANRELASSTGLEIGQGGFLLRAVTPIISDGELLGSAEAAISLAELLQSLNIHQEYGVAMLMDREFKDLWESTPILSEAGQWIVVKTWGAADVELVRQAVDTGLLEGRVGSVFFSTLPLDDAQGRRVGQLLLSFDASIGVQANNARSAQFVLLAICGSLAMWLALYLNVRRIRLFLDRLKKILIASQSNDFAERFESDHIHCQEILHCTKDGCPVYRNPNLVCYLETGSEAISPTWRNTCRFLDEYSICRNCPVYKLRHGDELMDIKAVINTLMRTWSVFLSRVGSLLSEVLRSQNRSGSLPSLDQVSEYLEQMAKLTAFSHDLQGVFSRDEVYGHLAHVFERHFGIACYDLMEVSASENRMEPCLRHGALGVPFSQEVLLNSDLCRARRAAEEVCSLPNPVLCPHFNIDPERQVRCCLPMVMGGRVGAVFTFIVPRSEWDMRSKQLVMLRRYLDETAPVLSSLRLLQASKEQSLRDPLTHCHNRRFLDAYISHFEPLSKRENYRAGLLMADLDNFKQVNDQHGHEAGDVVLRQVVAILRDSIRASDLLVRYGGEEFFIMLLEVQDGASARVAEKIRKSVEEHVFVLPGGAKIRKTISLGVADYPEHGDSIYRVLKFADTALYAAKNEGRNRVVRFRPEMWPDAGKDEEA